MSFKRTTGTPRPANTYRSNQLSKVTGRGRLTRYRLRQERREARDRAFLARMDELNVAARGV